jgi:hypothetical protein
MTKPMALPTLAAPRGFWQQRREASLNWLALGLLLAAWNASDDDGAQSVRRPDSLRGYAYVSVRAAQRSAGINP